MLHVRYTSNCNIASPLLGSRADYVATLCCSLSNEMRFQMMDEDARIEHYENSVLKEYDGKILKDWEIARYIEDRDLWWTRKNLERYICDHVMLIRPLPEVAKGDYGDEEELMLMTCPPVERTTDFGSDVGTDEERVDVPMPSPVKVQDIIDLRTKEPSQSKKDKAGPSRSSDQGKRHYNDMFVRSKT